MSTSTAWSRCCASNWNWNWKRSSSSSSCSSSSRRSARQHGNHRRRTPLNPRNNTRERRRFSARRRLRCDGQKNHDDFETTFDDDDDEEMLENFLEPPRRDTGIPSEWDINIDIDEGTRRSSRSIAIFRRDDGFSFLYHTSSEYTRRTNFSFAHLLSAYSSFFSLTTETTKQKPRRK